MEPYYTDEQVTGKCGNVPDPLPLRGGVCQEHGDFNNFSGECLACRREAGK